MLCFSAATASSVGLALDIIGVVLLYKYGLPEEVSRKGTSALLDYGTSEEETKTAEEEIRKAKHYDMMSRLALALLVFGFALQIVSNWL